MNGSLLKEAREKAGLNQGELGKLLGVKQAHLSMIERGLAIPGRDLAVRIWQWGQKNHAAIDVGAWGQFTKPLKEQLVDALREYDAGEAQRAGQLLEVAILARYRDRKRSDIVELFEDISLSERDGFVVVFTALAQSETWKCFAYNVRAFDHARGLIHDLSRRNSDLAKQLELEHRKMIEENFERERSVVEGEEPL